MGGYLIPIGGEFWFDDKLLNRKIDNFKNINAVFLSGGQSALRFIIQDIEIKQDEYVLMPSYLCTSILHNFNKLNVRFEFYKINKDLSIDLEDIKTKIEKYKVKAILFIDYFGFYHKKETIDYLKELRKENIILIEDAVQMFWFERKNFIGDYVFNSYRKFLPFDGSIVLCNNIKNYNFIEDKYYENINLARMKKTEFQNLQVGIEEDFLSLYEKAEEEYYKREDIIGIDEKSKELLSIVDYEYIFTKRKENYSYLYDGLITNDKLKIMYSKELIYDNSVLGLPILIDNRDEIRKKLRQLKIYCPVHWNILNEDWSKKYKESRYISSKILTLPIDQRYNLDDMNRLIYSINKLTGDE